jgi:HAD superfamily hydrolase (TIGR01459 family)
MTAPLIDHFGPLAPGYDVLLCDVWGVVHNGVAAFPEACDALAAFRGAGGTVILITNAPRASPAVQGILDRLGVPHGAYDAIMSSGDVTRGIVASRPHERVFHLGPERDHSIFAGLDVSFAPADAADYVVCSGLFDDARETPDDYGALLAAMRARSLFMVCANPDIVVERGDELVYCAGAIADAYAALGGEVLYCGKPHAPIYQAALAKAAPLPLASIACSSFPPCMRTMPAGGGHRTCPDWTRPLRPQASCRKPLRAGSPGERRQPSGRVSPAGEVSGSPPAPIRSCASAFGR